MQALLVPLFFARKKAGKGNCRIEADLAAAQEQRQKGRGCLCGVTAPEQLSVTIYDILKCIVMNEELPDKESCMIRTETGVDLIPANNKLDNFDKLMCDTDFAEYKLKEFVKELMGNGDQNTKNTGKKHIA